MKKLKINLENCYGINKLQYEFDFSNGRTSVVYAPNGVMKTSFAKTFKDIADNKTPCDQMDDSLIPIYDILDDSNNLIDSNQISVIEPYNEKAFNSEEKILTLLANEEIKEEYLNIYEELNLKKQSLIKDLKKVSQSTNCEDELIMTFSSDKKTIFEIFSDILDNVKESRENFNFRYNHVFDPDGKVKDFLEENEKLFKEYYTKYNELISGSEFFTQSKDCVFGTTEAKSLENSVDGNEFFIAGHKFTLKRQGDIDSKEAFSKILNEEVDKIFNDENLKKIFEIVEKKLNANQKLKDFKKVIEKDPSLIVQLNDYELFRKKVWFGYLKQNINNLESLVELYTNKKPSLEMIIEKANQQKSKWEEAIEEFHNRFANLPFTLTIDNKSDAILNMQTPAISFKFANKVVDRKKLLEVLSQGEKRALYLLNIIFEIRAREVKSQKTLFIIDDIADSFDYKNKYAIVEYLNDITKNPIFYSIILTHNFDFYRTITSRLGVLRINKLHAIKTIDDIKITQEVYQNSPFKTWRENMKSGHYFGINYNTTDARKHIIALIPFTRNLIEYSGSIDASTSFGSDFDALTSLLHSKVDTMKISFGDLKLIYKKHLNRNDFDASIVAGDIVYDTIINIADNMSDEEFNLENKIIFSIAIRHRAEGYMWSKITDKSTIKGNQTGELFRRYRDEFGNNVTYKNNIKILESVNIMTPENIHLNSFMYEPILDMGINELKNLYDYVCKLK